MVYANRWGRLELVPADKLSQAARAEMERFDRLPPSEREYARETNQIPETIRRDTGALKSVGLAMARRS